MNKRKLFVSACMIALAFGLYVAARPSPATYYISFSTGSNTNNGTSESTPWKTHPYMQAAAGCTSSGSRPTYSHVAGDHFVFKQGDSWPNACFDLQILAGGSSSNPDTYTFDPTWGTPGGTTGNTGQRVGAYQFNANNSIIHGTDGWDAYITNYAANDWITFNGMELTNFLCTADQTFGQNELITLYQSQNSTVSNIYVHNWSHGSSTADDMIVVGGYNTSTNMTGTAFFGSVIDGTSDGGKSGEALYAVPIVHDNIVENMSNGLIPSEPAMIYNNQIGPINLSFDPTDHENCIEPDGPYSGVTTTTYIFNNVWHDCTAAALLAAGNNTTNGSSIYYVFNNVAYVGSVSSPPYPIELSAVGSGGSNQAIIWNNSIAGGSTSECIRTLSQGGSWNVLNYQNNHCVSDLGLWKNDAGGGTVINNNNPTQTVAAATAQGYTAAEPFAYSPTAASNITVGAGVNLTSSATGPLAPLTSDTTYGGIRTTLPRPASGAWNAGAYQFNSNILQVGPGQTFTTIQACLNAATSGQICNVHAATYTENPAFTTSNVTLQVNSGDVGSTFVHGHISASAKNNCVITGFDVSGFTLVFNGSQTGGVDVRSSTGCQILNNTVHDGQGAGVYSRLNTNTLIQGNTTFNLTMSQCCFAEGDGIVSYSAGSTDGTYAHGVRILHNSVFQNAQDGIEINGSFETIATNTVHDNITSDYVNVHPDGIECNNDVDGITECPNTQIYGNTVFNHNQNIYIDGLGTAAANSNIWIFNNVVYNTPTSSTGVDMTMGSSSEVILNVGTQGYLFNNSITGVVQFFNICLGDCTGGGNLSWAFNNVQLANNIETGSLYYSFWTFPASSVTSTDYDDFFGAPNLINWGNTGYNVLSSFQVATGQETHGQNVNPLLNPNPTPTPQAGSPMINAGENLTTFPGAPAALLTDFNGSPRPSTGPWTVGALNSGAAPPTPVVSLSPSSVAFGNQTISTTSTAHVVTLSNTGTGTLNISSIALTGSNPGDFSQSNTCGTTVNAGNNCAITVRFTPTALGSRSASVTITDNASGSPHSVPLTGTGTSAPAPSVSFAPTSLPFGNQVISTTSSGRTVTLTNSGTATLTISAIAITGTNAGDFAQSATTCGGTLGAGLNCTITATFTPTALGPRSAAISVTDNATGSPQTVPLTGTGVTTPPAPVVTFAPTSLAFGNQIVSTPSAGMTTTLTNTGDATLTISAIAITGTNAADFGQVHTCGGSLGAGASCTITATFTPGSLGARSASISVTDNASGSPHTVPMTGTGVPTPPMPIVTLAPTSLAFGNQVQSTTSAPRTVTLTNSGSGTLTIVSIAVTGANASNFGQMNTCGTSLAPAASCPINVTFTPSALGSRSASVTITDNASGSPHTVPLTGTGVAVPVPAVSLAPASLPFGNQVFATTSGARVITLTNTGSATLTIASITITGTNAGDFGHSTTCGGTLAASANCTISVNFTPSALGARAAAVSVSDNATGSPQTVPLTGTGVVAPVVNSSGSGASILLAE